MSRYTGLTESQRYRRRLKGEANYIYACYADDFVILCNGKKRQAEALKEGLYEFLKGKLRLDLSKEKTKITHLNDGFKFLGFRIHRCRGKRGMVTKILIPKEAMEEVCDKIKRATTASTHQDSVNSKILALNRIVGGWCRYYQYTSKATSQYKRVSYLLFWRTAHWLGRKYRCSMPKVFTRYRQGNTLATKEQTLVMPVEDINTKIYKSKVFKPNPYTNQEKPMTRENLEDDYYWTGYERRPGMMDLRPLILMRDGYICQMCGRAVTDRTAQVDHIKPAHRFKRPIDANTPENLWTLCIESCHPSKSEGGVGKRIQ